MVDLRNFIRSIGIFGAIVEATKKFIRALYRAVVPLKLLLRRRGKKYKKSRRIGAIGLDDIIRIDGVALAFTHLRTVF